MDCIRPDMDTARAYLLDRAYMSGVERDADRIKATGEVFTPMKLVDKLIDRMERSDPPHPSDPAKRLLDPACGDGQFLAGALWRRLEKGHCLRCSLATIYGIELMPDNAEACRTRLACGVDDPAVKEILERNIVCADSLLYLEYHGRFDGTPFDAEAARAQKAIDDKAKAKAKAAARKAARTGQGRLL